MPTVDPDAFARESGERAAPPPSQVTLTIDADGNTTSGDAGRVENCLAEALFHRISRAILKRQTFRVIIVLPVWPGFEGEVETISFAPHPWLAPLPPSLPSVSPFSIALVLCCGLILNSFSWLG